MNFPTCSINRKLQDLRRRMGMLADVGDMIQRGLMAIATGAVGIGDAWRFMNDAQAFALSLKLA